MIWFGDLIILECAMASFQCESANITLHDLIDHFKVIYIEPQIASQ